jgi:UDP-glucose 4-epimerase
VRYLITGGAGFIGSHLAESLLARGDTVVALDDLSTGSMGNVRHLKKNPRFTLVADTMMNAGVLRELVDDCERVFHLAAAVGVKLIVESPVRTIETNVGCTELLLDVAHKKKRRVFLASTSEVYGKSADIPFREDGDLVLGAPSRGRWSYACSKAIDEFLAIAYWRERGLPIVVGRFFNTVGPRQTGQYGMVVPRFVQQALAGEPLTVYGDGGQSRCFTHVSDAVRAALALMDAGHTTGEIYNIGSTHEITIRELARRVVEMTGSSSGISYVPYDEAYSEGFEDMPRRVPSLDKIRDAVGYCPIHDLDAILSAVISHFRLLAPVVIPQD